MVLWMWRTNSHGLQKSCGDKGQHGHSLSERVPRLFPGQASIAFLEALHQGRSSFIMHRFALKCDYFLQVTKKRPIGWRKKKKKRMLPMQGKKWLNWLHSILGRFGTNFRKLLQRYALNICCLNSGSGSFSKSKPQSSLGIMQAWFPMGKLICGPGSCVLPRACQFSEPGLSYIRIATWTGSL